MIQTKRIYDPVLPEDGKRVLVDRLWPRGVKKDEARVDDWLKDIAPSDELRKWFSHDPANWLEFKKRYKKELKNKFAVLEQIRKESEKETITLLFAAKDVEHNNAVALKEIIGQRS